MMILATPFGALVQGPDVHVIAHKNQGRLFRNMKMDQNIDAKRTHTRTFLPWSHDPSKRNDESVIDCWML
ncbi:hypothetical protein WN55_04863 [Dufourea novaeangliae]|uniref:Uncharacterized protein n=1 Tax=Dufourea novaeangliae TaxID=178035 RepID=A0A154PM86_DUFNO|nr:hypothetical protein WN55_04863 [Dufourea novaeangliae]